MRDPKKEDTNIAILVYNLMESSNQEIKDKCINICKDNGIEKVSDLLELNDDDINALNFPLLFTKKLKNELKKLKENKSLLENEKILIKTLFEQDLPFDVILNSLGEASNSQKADLIKEYYHTLKKPVKPIPQDLKLLNVKTTEKPLPCYQYHSKEYKGKRYYTLLVMGETGTGKTTLLDAFVNYLTNMNFEDQWRYKLVDENDIKDKANGESQTSIITDYFVNFHRESGTEINIRIVDTPGLGDTKGILQDNKIIKQFETFFKEVGELDYILITVKANTTRWTQANQYIYDRVQEVFGKDAKERFILMCTFSDGQKPLAVKTLENKIHFEEYFCFNNSALYVPKELATPNTKFFWNLGLDNVKRFFEFIIQKNLPPLSLTLSQQVLLNREWLFANVESSQKRVNEGFKMLEKSRDLLEAIKKNKELIDKNENFKYITTEKIPETIYLNDTYQFCSICNQMCCQCCKWPQNQPYSMCTYFKDNGVYSESKGCPCCPGHCRRRSHVRANSYIVYKEIKKEEICEVKKKNFNEGKSGLSISDQLLNETIEKMSNQGKLIFKEMEEIKNSLKKLDEIALKPRVLTNVEYFQQMIDYEKDQKNPGYQKRIEGLEIMKSHAQQLNDISKANDIIQLFPKFNEVINQLKEKSESKKESKCSIF